MNYHDNYKEYEFAMYNRKSSESDERQALSIESQRERNQQTAEYYDIKIKPENIIEESKSAKKSGMRPEFNKLLGNIRKGKIHGIIVWNIDRISRNAGDAGQVIDLIDEEKLKYVITPQQTFKNLPNDKMMLNFYCMQAKVENDHKGEGVKRGLIKKREMGYPPHGVGVGYLNDSGEKGYRTIYPDPERFEVVKQLFQMYLTRKYSARQLHIHARDELGLTSVPRKSIGGTPISKTAFYGMLRNPIYAGFFYGKNAENEMVRYEVHKSVPRMITETQHKKVISLLKRNGNPRPWSHVDEYPFKQFLKCGSCGGSVTAERKNQVYCFDCKKKTSILQNNVCNGCGRDIYNIKKKTIIDITYYRCCNRNTNCKSVEGSKTETTLTNKLLEDYAQKLAISPALKEWCLDSIGILEQKEKKEGKKIEKTWLVKLEEYKSKQEKLLDAHLNNLIDNEEYKAKKAEIQDKVDTLTAKIDPIVRKKIDMKELQRKFDILTEFADVIKNGDYEEKIEALSLMGSNLTITREKISISKTILYRAIERGLYEAKLKNPMFEPEKYQANKEQTEAFASVCPTLLRE
ncbi:MAG: recombinase family protein [Patescibacteria group bacterium UBA2163]